MSVLFRGNDNTRGQCSLVDDIHGHDPSVYINGIEQASMENEIVVDAHIEGPCPLTVPKTTNMDGANKVDYGSNKDAAL